MTKEHLTYAELGEKIRSERWGLSNSNILAFSDEKMMLCLLSSMIDTLTKISNQLNAIDSQLRKRQNDPAADALLEHFNLKNGDKLIQDMDLKELGGRIKGLLIRDGIKRRSQIIEKNLLSFGWGEYSRQKVLDWAQRDKEQDEAKSLSKQ
jgi:hypothetical protein